MATDQRKCKVGNIRMPYYEHHQHVSGEGHTAAMAEAASKDKSKKDASTVAKPERGRYPHKAPTGGVKEWWLCTVCNRKMMGQNKDAHLSGKPHAAAIASQVEYNYIYNIYNPTSSSSEAAIRRTQRTGGDGSKLLPQNYRKATRKNDKAEKQMDETTSQALTPPDGPLDSFFRSFIGFPYDASLPPSDSFQLLRYRGGSWHYWGRNTYETRKDYEDELWERYQAALTSEFNMWFGTEDDINAWHSLCRAIGIHPLPTTGELCQIAIRNRHVNIVDLIQWGREGKGGEVTIFKTVKKLSEYTYKEDRIYQKKQLGQGVVLRHLLRKLASWQ